MFALSPTVLLAFVLSGPAVVTPEAVICHEGVRHLELLAVPTGEPPSVCVSPGRTTLFSFDAELLAGSVNLEGSTDFSRIEVGPTTLKLIPSGSLNAGARRQVRVNFKDGSVPRSAVFTLIAQAAQAEALVNVYRQARTVESYQQELAEKEAEARECLAENARLRREQEGPGGIAGLRTARLMDVSGVASRDIFKNVSQASTGMLRVMSVTAYRAAMRIAVEMEVEVPENAPAWEPRGASLSSQVKKGVELKVLGVWSLGPSDPRRSHGGGIFIEAEAPASTLNGPFMLKLWDASGTRTVTLTGVTFS